MAESLLPILIIFQPDVNFRGFVIFYWLNQDADGQHEQTGPDGGRATEALTDHRGGVGERIHLLAEDHRATLCDVRADRLGLHHVVRMLLCSMLIETMRGSIPTSYEDGGGLLFGLFCFYVTCFAVAWCWGARRRVEMRKIVVEKQIERQRAIDALMEKDL